MYVVTLSVFHNLAIWLLYVNKPEPDSNYGRICYHYGGIQCQRMA